MAEYNIQMNRYVSSSDSYDKLYPKTKTIDVIDQNGDNLDTLLSEKIDSNEKGVANGVASLGSDGKVPSGQLPSLNYIPTSQKGAVNGVASLGSNGKIPTSQIPSLNYIPTSQKGAVNGVASLGADGKVPSAQLPPIGGMTEAQVNAKLGRTTAVDASDTNYTTYMARGIALFTDIANPTVNGTIALRYY